MCRVKGHFVSFETRQNSQRQLPLLMPPPFWTVSLVPIVLVQLPLLLLLLLHDKRALRFPPIVFKVHHLPGLLALPLL